MGSDFENHHCSSFGLGRSTGRNGLRRVNRKLTLIVVQLGSLKRSLFLYVHVFGTHRMFEL